MMTFCNNVIKNVIKAWFVSRFSVYNEKWYFKKFDYTSPFVTAIIFTLIVMILDFFVVAMVIEKNLEMFESVMGTWLPFLFIFLTVWLRGLAIHRGEE